MRQHADLCVQEEGEGAEGDGGAGDNANGAEEGAEDTGEVARSLREQGLRALRVSVALSLTALARLASRRGGRG